MWARHQRKYSLKKKYGLSEADYTQMLEAQGGRCRICGGKPKQNRLAVHDHETGEIRGLLCGPCNVSLGRLERYFCGIMAYLKISKWEAK